jgi:glyoxylase-like metal-dependent hydrolase (beta-lactamase superfamily II)
MVTRMRALPFWIAAVTLALAGIGCAPGKRLTWCDRWPRPSFQALEKMPVPDPWFEVYRAGTGVFAIAEPHQFQEVISYLIVGRDSALLFDTGLGMRPIRPVVEALTRLPITALNSHTHYDHVGGNSEFDRLLAMDTEYTRANAAGHPHNALAGEVEPTSFCHGAPPGLDTASFQTRPFTPTRYIHDGYRIDLGGRTLTVLSVPGHTPDAVAVLDSAAGYLFTGDTFYESAIWLYAPETDLDAYQRSLDRLITLVPRLTRLFPAHNETAGDPRLLEEARRVFGEIRAGRISGLRRDTTGRVFFPFQHFSFLTSEAALAGIKSDPARGGSGLEVPPRPPRRPR